jgi:hypothetical protein
MINIYRKGNKVCVSIETGLNTQKDIEFSVDCVTEVFAELLSKQLDKKLRDRIERIRKTEYLSGRKDSRKPGKKRDWFYTSLIDHEY